MDVCYFTTHICYRNLQKREKKARYEREKAFMETVRGVGCAVGEYVGNGQGEAETATQDLDLDDVRDDVDADPVESLDDENDNFDVDAQPLWIFYDCETTGFSIYSEHITDIAAKVVASPVPVTSPTFTRLVKTSRSISSAGMIANATTFTYLTISYLNGQLPRLQVSPPRRCDKLILSLLFSLYS